MTLRSTLGRTSDFGSVHNAPELPGGFAEVFDSHIVPSGSLNLTVYPTLAVGQAA